VSASAVVADSNTVLNSVRERIASGIPTGWKLTTLGESFKWSSGGTPRRTEPAYFDGEIPWAVIGDLNDGVVTETEKTITKAGLENSSAKWVEPGSILVAMYGSIGKLGIAARRITTNQAIAFTKPDPVDTKYLFYYLLWQRPSLSRLGKGATQLNISQTVLKEFPFVWAPLNDQHRVVAEIEKQFSRLDEAVANLKRVKAHLVRFQSSVLSDATDGWATVPLRDILREPLRNGHSAKATDDPNGLRAFTLTAVTEGDFSEGNTKRTIADAKKVADLWAQPGDIYVERSNTPELVGTTRLYRGPANFAFIPDLLIRVRVNNDALPEYVELALRSERGRRYFRSRAQGIAGSMPKIDQGTVESFPVPLPPIEKQQGIIAEVDRRLSVVHEIEEETQISLERAKVLRQRVLSEAFAQPAVRR
jgi:type I restriction enzyme S subunit